MDLGCILILFTTLSSCSCSSLSSPLTGLFHYFHYIKNRYFLAICWIGLLWRKKRKKLYVLFMYLVDEQGDLPMRLQSTMSLADRLMGTRLPFSSADQKSCPKMSCAVIILVIQGNNGSCCAPFHFDSCERTTFLPGIYIWCKQAITELEELIAE